MLDVVLAELEGVVFETDALRLAALEDAFVAQRVECPIDAHSLRGLSPRNAAALALDAASVAADDVLLDLIALSAARAFSSRLALAGAQLQRGARAFLEHAAGVARVGIVTRAARADVDTLIRLSGLEMPFAVVICSDDVLDPKPAVESYRVALERLSRLRPVSRANVLALESSADGIRSARAAGIPCIAVGDVAAHVAMDADAFVASLAGHSLVSLETLAHPGRERVQ